MTSSLGLVGTVSTPQPARGRRASAVDMHRGAGDVTREVARQEEGGTGAVVLIAPAHGDLGVILLAPALHRGLAEPLVAGSRDGVGGDRIDADALEDEFEGE